jgi:hypothetical protein
VGVSSLTPEIRQLSLFDQPPAADNEKHQKLQAAMQKLRQRYGENILQHASDLSEHPK